MGDRLHHHGRRSRNGYAQFHPSSKAADQAREMGIPDVAGSYGLDIFIGETDTIGIGIGSRAVALLSRYLLEERVRRTSRSSPRSATIARTVRTRRRGSAR